MENGTVHNPSIITSEVVMETDNPPNNWFKQNKTPFNSNIIWNMPDLDRVI